MCQLATSTASSTVIHASIISGSKVSFIQVRKNRLLDLLLLDRLTGQPVLNGDAMRCSCDEQLSRTFTGLCGELCHAERSQCGSQKPVGIVFADNSSAQVACSAPLHAQPCC